MPTDFQINLAKSLVSTEDERKRFYNGMLVYLVVCALFMVYAGYFSSLNIVEGLRAQRHKTGLVKAVTSVSEFSKSFFKDPEKVYARMEQHAADLDLLQAEMMKRSNFLPVISLLASEFPEDVALEGLKASAKDKTISFGLVLPISNAERGDPVRQLQADWSNNKDLMKRILSLRRTNSERRMVSGYPVSFVQFECVLK